MSFLNHLISGISLGSIYAIIALGYTMVYGIAKMCIRDSRRRARGYGTVPLGGLAGCGGQPSVAAVFCQYHRLLPVAAAFLILNFL